MRRLPRTPGGPGTSDTSAKLMRMLSACIRRVSGMVRGLLSFLFGVMQKLLLFILLLVGIYFLRRALAGKKDGGGAGGKQDGPKPVAGETIESCTHCGLMVPRSEGVSSGDRFYCSDEHARLGPPRS